MRLITDPIVDSIVYIIVKLLFPRLVKLVQAVLRLFVTKYTRGLLGSSMTSGISDFSGRIVCEISYITSTYEIHIIFYSTIAQQT